MTKIIDKIKYINNFIVADIFTPKDKHDLWILVGVDYDPNNHELRYTLTNDVKIIDNRPYRNNEIRPLFRRIREDELLEHYQFYRRLRKVPNELSNICNSCPMYGFDEETCAICQGTDYRDEWNHKSFFLIGDMCMKVKKGSSGIIRYGLGIVYSIELTNTKLQLDSQVIENHRPDLYTFNPHYRLMSDGKQRKGILSSDQIRDLGISYGTDLTIYMRQGIVNEFDRKKNLCEKACIYSNCAYCKIRSL